MAVAVLRCGGRVLELCFSRLSCRGLTSKKCAVLDVAAASDCCGGHRYAAMMNHHTHHHVVDCGLCCPRWPALGRKGRLPSASLGPSGPAARGRPASRPAAWPRGPPVTPKMSPGPPAPKDGGGGWPHGCPHGARLCVCVEDKHGLVGRRWVAPCWPLPPPPQVLSRPCCRPNCCCRRCRTARCWCRRRFAAAGTATSPFVEFAPSPALLRRRLLCDFAPLWSVLLGLRWCSRWPTCWAARPPGLALALLALARKGAALPPTCVWTSLSADARVDWPERSADVRLD